MHAFVSLFHPGRRRAALAALACASLLAGALHSQPAADASSEDAGLCAGPARKLDAPVRESLVYGDEALVAREGRANLGAGATLLCLDDLPAGLKDASIRVQIEPVDSNADVAADALRIEEIRLEERYRQVYLSEAAREAEERLRDAETKLRALTERHAALQEEEASLRALRPGQSPPAEERNPPVDAARWRETLDFIQSGLARNHAAQGALYQEIDQAREELSVALVLAERYRSAADIRRKQLLLRVRRPENAAQDLPVDLRIEYRLDGAAWRPVYQARVSGGAENPRLSLAAYALVRNESGEDWNNVRLDFSAADPEEATGLVALREWRIRARIVAVQESGSRGGGRSDRRSRPQREADVAESSPASGVADARSSGFADVVADEEPQESAANQADDDGFVLRKSSGGLSPAAELQQRRLSEQSRRSQEYIQSNIAEVQDERAAKRSSATRATLEAYQQNREQRERSYGRGDYDDAVRYSDAVLESIHRLAPQYRDDFAEDERRSREIKARSLEMLEVQSLVQRLVPPQRSARGFDYRYAARARENLPSDGAYRKVLLFEEELPLKLRYEAAPSARTVAFLAGEATRPRSETRPLLAGPVQVFHNRDYVGLADLPVTAGGESLQLSLGANDNLRIQRRTGEKRDDSGIFGTTRRSVRWIEIRAANQERRAVSLDLFERIPVSNDERIRITNVTTSVAPAERRKGYGLYRFRLELKPGEEQIVRIEYTLQHPEDVLPVEHSGGGPQW